MHNENKNFFLTLFFQVDFEHIYLELSSSSEDGVTSRIFLVPKIIPEGCEEIV